MATTVSNKTLVYKQPPEGMIRANVDMVFEERPITLTPPPRGMVVKTLTIGFDPHMRDRMRGPDFQSYVPGYVPEEPMNTFAVAKVLKSDNEKFVDGDLVAGVMPIAEYGIIPEEVSFSFFFFFFAPVLFSFSFSFSLWGIQLGPDSGIEIDELTGDLLGM